MHVSSKRVVNDIMHNPSIEAMQLYGLCMVGKLFVTIGYFFMVFIFSQYNVLLYSVDERCLATFKAYEYALGIKSIAWSPSSQFLAIGSFDQKVSSPMLQKSSISQASKTAM